MLDRSACTTRSILVNLFRLAIHTEDHVGKLLRAYLRLLAVLTALSCLGLLFLPTQLGARTPWGTAPGWQREIAIWDLTMYILIVRTLRSADAVAARLLVTALVVLNLQIGRASCRER